MQMMKWCDDLYVGDIDATDEIALCCIGKVKMCIIHAHQILKVRKDPPCTVPGCTGRGDPGNPLLGGQFWGQKIADFPKNERPHSGDSA